MKKKGLMGLLAVGLLVGLLLPASLPVLADDLEDAAQLQTLFAGQDIDVGVVKVWNDTENLYVKYETSGDWVMTEYHLEVVCSLGDFPTTNKGNPKVGHFTYGGTLDPSVTVWLETIALDDLACSLLYVAAHAVVVRPIDGCWETVWQIGDVEEVVDGRLTCYYDEFNYSGIPGDSGYPQVPAYDNPFVVGISGDNNFPWLSNPNRDGYGTDFYVNWSGELPFGGRLTLSWSPGRSADETKTVTADTSETATWVVLGAPVTPGPTNWGTPNAQPLVENSLDLGVVGDGSHSLRFQHTTGDGALWDWVRLEKPCEQWESAWAEGDLFVTKANEKGKRQGNWATWFTYCVKDWKYVQTVSVPSSGAVASSSPLANGMSYRFDASETFTYNSAGDWADAEWYLKSGVIVKGDTEGSKEYVLDLSIDGYSINRDWGAYNDSHEYSMDWVGTGDAVDFSIYDSNSSDNVGSLIVDIYVWACPSP